MAETRMRNIGFQIANAAALCLALTVSSGASADCMAVTEWRDRTVRGSPAFDVGPAEQTIPALQALVIQAYNLTPPESSADPDAVFMLMSRVKVNGMPFGDVMFGLFKGGCLIATFTAPLPHGKRGEPI